MVMVCDEERGGGGGFEESVSPFPLTLPPSLALFITTRVLCDSFTIYIAGKALCVPLTVIDCTT